MRKNEIPAKGDRVEAEKLDMQCHLHGSNQGYHHDGSGRFFIRLGDEYAGATIKLMAK